MVTAAKAKRTTTTNAVVVRNVGAITRRRSSRARRSLGIPLAVVAGFIPILNRAVQGYRAARWYGFAQGGVIALTGYDLNTGGWQWKEMLGGLIPVALGVVIHELANKYGVNAELKRFGIPIIRV